MHRSVTVEVIGVAGYRFRVPHRLPACTSRLTGSAWSLQKGHYLFPRDLQVTAATLEALSDALQEAASIWGSTLPPRVPRFCLVEHDEFPLVDVSDDMSCFVAVRYCQTYTDTRCCVGDIATG